MATFVFVHGSWGGGFQWKEVAKLLRSYGHDVYTPTLTGLGERKHLSHPAIGFHTHVDDILGVLEYEDLENVVRTTLQSGHLLPYFIKRCYEQEMLDGQFTKLKAVGIGR
ncbi:alpha/beta fold hydrolase [Paenibacillus tyrfis]|uniref:AB hydrolase-1 domain-containing protein n=1 Tax=Paenibacillus tyrfis TaxID=1501230 RepID=A0A081NVI1_9BACL|nr:alpha/beta fold hydrolase [Paenibacillus tyrfis]KEQ22454.1 hypothetical protein ET33_23270 [Paenibacillus tyrfis]